MTPAAVTSWSRVTTIEASHFDVNTAYASVDRHQLQDFEPYIYRTRDKGKTWQKITAGLPAGVYVHVVKEDPMRRGLLFAGTERGAFVSFDDGDSWQRLQLNLPVDVGARFRDLRQRSHRRDARPRHLGDRRHQSAAPADARRGRERRVPLQAGRRVYLAQGGDNGTPLQKDEPQAPNPVNGAAIDYYLKADTSGPVSLEILDVSGHHCRDVLERAVERERRRPRRPWRRDRHFEHVAACGARRQSHSRRRPGCTASNGRRSPRAEVAAAVGAAAAARRSRACSRRDSRRVGRPTRRLST